MDETTITITAITVMLLSMSVVTALYIISTVKNYAARKATEALLEHYRIKHVGEELPHNLRLQMTVLYYGG